MLSNPSGYGTPDRRRAYWAIIGSSGGPTKAIAELRQQLLDSKMSSSGT